MSVPIEQLIMRLRQPESADQTERTRETAYALADVSFERARETFPEIPQTLADDLQHALRLLAHAVAVTTRNAAREDLLTILSIYETMPIREGELIDPTRPYYVTQDPSNTSDERVQP